MSEPHIYGYDHSKRRPADPAFDANGVCISAADWLGERFAVGEDVIYCIGAGRGQMMAIGRVLQIKAEPMQNDRYRDPYPGEEPTRHVMHWVNSARVPIPVVDLHEPYHDITVQVLTRKASGHWNNRERTRPAWVNPMNITALPITEWPL